MLFADLEQKIKGLSPEIIETKRANAVLLPLLDTERGVCLLFEKRSETVWQPGETCFPGGGIEKGETPQIAALRETTEELGISPEDIEILADFDVLVGLGGFVLYSVIGKLKTYSFYPSQEEVADLFTVPLDFFMNTEPKVYKFAMEPQIPKDFDYSVFGVKGPYPWRKSENIIYAWEYEGHHIWGLTAKLIYQLISKIR